MGWGKASCSSCSQRHKVMSVMPPRSARTSEAGIRFVLVTLILPLAQNGARKAERRQSFLRTSETVAAVLRGVVFLAFHNVESIKHLLTNSQMTDLFWFFGGSILLGFSPIFSYKIVFFQYPVVNFLVLMWGIASC